MCLYVRNISMAEGRKLQRMVRRGADRIKMRRAQAELATGQTVGQVCKQLGITEDHTYYRWRKEYGSPKTDQAPRLKDLDRENARLKRLAADLTLDNAILKEVANPNS